MTAYYVYTRVMFMTPNFSLEDPGSSTPRLLVDHWTDFGFIPCWWDAIVGRSLERHEIHHFPMRIRSLADHHRPDFDEGIVRFEPWVVVMMPSWGLGGPGLRTPWLWTIFRKLRSNLRMYSSINYLCFSNFVLIIRSCYASIKLSEFWLKVL